MTALAAVVQRPNESNHMNDSNNNKVGILDINCDTGRAYWGPQLRDLLGVAREVPADFDLLLKAGASRRPACTRFDPQATREGWRL
jgi:hypothetical protein